MSNLVSFFEQFVRERMFVLLKAPAASHHIFSFPQPPERAAFGASVSEFKTTLFLPPGADSLSPSVASTAYQPPRG